ncbi:glycosyltransferase [Candidatus Nitrosocosmicus oleophilus]|uniref:glycosyltransferase n=1 Tax=Candidatus Nitrosocosmicus oleophilus TaxID=1353260 RepID=UPI0018CA65E9|nr:glycosyltransferase [Candidatus Nitrosocosmicus oleophilus]
MHLSTEGLPDWRIEKSALTALNKGHEVVFAGSKSPFIYNRNTFSKIYEVIWTAKARYGFPYYWHMVKKQIYQIIKEVLPDIVHAHNIFSAKMMLEFDIPFVYDDHEFWSRHSQLLLEMDKLNEIQAEKVSLNETIRGVRRRVKRKIINRHVNRLWAKWERELVSSVPTITVSNEIANKLRVIGNSNKIFVVHNFPMKFEVGGLGNPRQHDQLSSVYAGSDGHNKKKYPSRNIDGLTDIFTNNNVGDLTIIGWNGEFSEKIKYTGFLDRNDMYEVMSNNSIGLIPFKKHWSHEYINPNKAYEYAHAGLLVMCTNSFKEIKSVLKEHCVTFDDYEEMKEELLYFKNNMDELYYKRINLFEYARNNLIWELNEKQILEAYKIC